MFHFLFRILLLGAMAAFGFLALFHVFPYILGVLALIGLFKLYQSFKRPKLPPPSG
jgi:hypothetical protein